MADGVSRKFRLFGYVLLCCAGTAIAGMQALTWGNQLSPVDPYSEANALREVDGFRAQGFWHDAGLGNVLFGTKYPQVGFASEPDDRLDKSVARSGVYTHYPPGPEYILYVTEGIFGSEPVSTLRLVPLALCAAATVYFGLSVRRRFGEIAGWLVMLAVLIVVPLHDAHSSIHYLGYVQALLVVEIGFCLGVHSSFLPLILLGFLQGWMSFDYCFEVAFVPLAVELTVQRVEPLARPRYYLALWRCTLAVLGFSAAHMLHLVQIAIVHGSLSGAIADLSDSAAYRNGVGEMHNVFGYARTIGGLIGWYLISPHPVSAPFLQPDGPLSAYRMFGLTLLPFWLVTALVLSRVEQHLVRSRKPSRHLVRRWAAVGIAGIAVSSLWWLVMPSHAAAHMHLQFRHLSVCLVLWLIFLSVQLAPVIERWIATGLSTDTGHVSVAAIHTHEVQP